MARAFPAARALALVAAAGLALAACGDDTDDAAAPEASSSASPRTGDGTLKIGTLLPETGSLEILGPPEIAAVKLAVQDINEAGGVLGKDVEVEYRDSGDTSTDIANQSVDDLLDAGVDAVVGAASSSVTLTVIDKITGSGVLQISPANTSTTLSEYKDQDLYFRTAPSDVYQGRVVGETALADGAETLGILALQDAYGTSLADQAEQAFTDGGGEVVEKKIYDPKADEYSSEVGSIVDANPDAIALIGFGPDTAKMLDEMVKQGLLPLADSGKSLIMVDGNMSNTIDVGEGLLAGVKGTIPGSNPGEEFQTRLKEIDAGLADYSYAGEAYDAVTMLALAAEVAESDSGADMAESMPEVSSGGEKCDTFEACKALLEEDKDFDYDGQSGPVEFDDNGDVSAASMGVYQFGDDNKYKALRFVKGNVDGSGDTTTEEVDQASTESGDDADATASPSPTAGSAEEADAEESASPEATSTP